MTPDWYYQCILIEEMRFVKSDSKYNRFLYCIYKKRVIQSGGSNRRGMKSLKEPLSERAPLLAGLLCFATKNAVMFIALIAAVATSFIVPPDKEYIG